MRKSIGAPSRALWAGVVGVVVSGAGVPQQLRAQSAPIEELQAIAPDGAVELEVVVHSLVIEAWDRNEVQVVGEYDPGVDEVEVQGGTRSFRLTIESIDGGDRSSLRGSSELRVRVPPGVRLEAESVSGSVRVVGLSGSVRATAISGDVSVRGDVESAVLESTSGSVDYSGDSPSVRLGSISGDVTFSGASEEVRLESVSGSVSMDGRARSVEASSVSGEVEIVSSAGVESLEAESVSGRVSYSGGLARGGSIEAESHSGPVDLTLGDGVDARFELSTFSGGIETSLAGTQDERRSERRFAPGESVSFTTGAGSGRVRATSFSGGVTVR